MTIRTIYDPGPELEHTQSVSSVRNRQTAKLCMLILTHRCNLNCSYCYEKYKSNRNMSIDDAKKYVEEQVHYVETSSQYEWLVVELFGGEPLLRFELIRELLDWTRTQAWTVPVMYMITTNGTLLNEEKQEWFRRNRDLVVIGMSYDGSEKNQLMNRGCSQLSPLQFCHETWPNQSFRMTVSRESLPTLAKDILETLKSGYKLRAELAGGLSWTSSDREVYEQQLRLLKAAYLSHPEYFPVLLGRYFKGGENASAPCIKACGTGEITTCYDVDGTTYPCQMFLPLTLGDRALPLSRFDLSKEESFNDPECVGCPIKHWCPTCYGMNFITRGSTALRDHTMCKMHLTSALVTAEYQMELLTQSPLNEESAALVKFLLRIHREITTLLSD